MHASNHDQQSVEVSSDTPDPALTITSEQRGRLVVVSVAGNVDMVTAPQLSQLVTETLADAPDGLIIDLSDTDFLASAGMTALINAHSEIGPEGVFGVVARGPSTARPLELMGLNKVFSIYPDVDAALAAMTT